MTHLRGSTPTDASRNCSAEYQKQMQELRAAVELVKQRIDQHQKLQKKDPENWGYVGDLEHLNNMLGDAWVALDGVNEEQGKLQAMQAEQRRIKATNQN